VDQYKVTSGIDFSLDSYTADDTSGFTGTKAEAKRHLKALRKELAELQFLLWAEDKHKLLVVLQAMDTGGKDGTIRNVFKGVNPQGVWVANFKAPTDEELAHDYLWRVHPHTPGNGEIAVFNRSHYEDVLVVRVLELISRERWSRRYGHIVDFEKRLADEGTTIVKIYLNISREEQATRLQARLDDPERNWKFNAGDLDHRKLWDQYMEAFQDAIAATATASAPWYVVPANAKWYRNIVVAQILVDTLKALAMKFPDPEDGLDSVVIV
jgi:PPK2 family polyphosphate:nucleotide phosphotransferase